ncbi:MAG: hypothetical protein J2P51_13435, partial [Hyphomicrobiaceae bacterium]|nr:hypothetical protein [Hyphomicrobiaceae bacterium]
RKSDRDDRRDGERGGFRGERGGFRGERGGLRGDRGGAGGFRRDREGGDRDRPRGPRPPREREGEAPANISPANASEES